MSPASGKPWFVPNTRSPRPIYVLNAEDISTRPWQPMTSKTIRTFAEIEVGFTVKK